MAERLFYPVESQKGRECMKRFFTNVPGLVLSSNSERKLSMEVPL